MVINPARIDFPKTASGHKSSFSLTRQAQTNRYDRRIFVLTQSLRSIITTGAFGLGEAGAAKEKIQSSNPIVIMINHRAGGAAAVQGAWFCCGYRF
jgi:hypothetical protein